MPEGSFIGAEARPAPVASAGHPLAPAPRLRRRPSRATRFIALGAFAVALAGGGVVAYRNLDQDAIAQERPAPDSASAQAPASQQVKPATAPQTGAPATPYGSIATGSALKAPPPPPMAKKDPAALAPDMQAVIFSGKPSSPSEKVTADAPAASAVAPASAPPTSAVSPVPADAPATASAPPQPAEAAPEIPASMQQDLLAHADAMIKQGDIAGARVVLDHLDRAGNAQASFLLGQTWDPVVLNQWNVRGGIRGDRDKAIAYYRRAADGGIEPAKRSLASLNASH